MGLPKGVKEGAGQMPSLFENLGTLEEMTVIIAHEIKNPITSALANLALIEVSDDERKYESYCSTIEEELYLINQIVTDSIRFYTYSRRA